MEGVVGKAVPMRTWFLEVVGGTHDRTVRPPHVRVSFVAHGPVEVAVVAPPRPAAPHALPLLAAGNPDLVGGGAGGGVVVGDGVVRGVVGEVEPEGIGFRKPRGGRA